MKLNKVTIDEILRNGETKALAYKEELVISDHFAQEYMFIEPCRLDAITLLFCTGGTLRYRVNLQEYEVSEPCVLLNLPENIVQLVRTDDLKLFAVFISTHMLQAMPNDMLQRAYAYMALNKNNHRALVPLHRMAELMPFYELTKSTLAHPQAETEDIIRSLMMSFLLNVFALFSEYRPTQLAETDPTNSRGNRRLYDRFMELLSRYHQQERQVQFYADKMCVSSKYLSMAVKEYSGKCPSDWIADYVVAEAKSLLHYSDLSVQEVAFRLNFPSQSSFGKFFKQQTGISPLKYAQSSGK